MGGIIGGGIFVNPAEVARRVGSPGLSQLAWAIGGAIALIGAFVYAELAARRPQVGGQYAYLRDAYHPLVAFLYGWTLLLVVQTGGMAAAAMIFGRYARELTGITTPEAIIAVGTLDDAHRDQLHRRAGRQQRPVVLHGREADGDRDRRVLRIQAHDAGPSRADRGARESSRRRGDRGDDGAGSDPVHLRWLADGELRQRRDARSAKGSATRSPRRRHRRRDRVSPRQHGVSRRARDRRARGEQGAGVRRDACRSSANEADGSSPPASRSPRSDS